MNTLAYGGYSNDYPLSETVPPREPFRDQLRPRRRPDPGGSQVIWQRRRHQGHLLTAAHRDVMLNRVSKPPRNLLKISTKCMFFGLVGISIEFSTRYRSSFSQERSSFREIAG